MPINTSGNEYYQLLLVNYGKQGIFAVNVASKHYLFSLHVKCGYLWYNVIQYGSCKESPGEKGCCGKK